MLAVAVRRWYAGSGCGGGMLAVAAAVVCWTPCTLVCICTVVCMSKYRMFIIYMYYVLPMHVYCNHS